MSLVSSLNTFFTCTFCAAHAQSLYSGHRSRVLCSLQESSLEQTAEVATRQLVCLLLKFSMMVIQSTGLASACTSWYVLSLGSMATCHDGHPAVTPRLLHEAGTSFHDLCRQVGVSVAPDTPDLTAKLPASLKDILALSRKLCLIVWLFHARDQLSVALRKYMISCSAPVDMVGASTYSVCPRLNSMLEAIAWKKLCG